MAAESLDYRPNTGRTPAALLYEPDFPLTERFSPGWCWQRERRVRRHADDEFGARVQIAIARYALTQYTRDEMARDLTVSVKTAQDYLTGRSQTVYAAPVIRALERLGVPVTKGRWWASEAGKEPRRPLQIIRAQADVLRRVRSLIGGGHWTPAGIDEIQADLILLSLVVDDRP